MCYLRQALELSGQAKENALSFSLEGLLGTIINRRRGRVVKGMGHLDHV